jgi:hypothetical protein
MTEIARDSLPTAAAQIPTTAASEPQVAAKKIGLSPSAVDLLRAAEARGLVGLVITRADIRDAKGAADSVAIYRVVGTADYANVRAWLSDLLNTWPELAIFRLSLDAFATDPAVVKCDVEIHVISGPASTAEQVR